MEVLTRTEGQCKKSFYRRLAQMRKDKWASQYRNRDDHYRFHFMTTAEEEKTKPISKNEPKCQQRIRNRMAAQESRERHRTYVEELQRKARLYDQLVENQQMLCRNCRQNLTCDLSESQEQSQTVSKTHTELDREKQVKQLAVESYLEEHVIRIDNGSATTPFGIFFILSVVAVIAIASIHSLPTTSPRLLVSNPVTLQQTQGTQLRNFAEYIRTHSHLPPEECKNTGQKDMFRAKNLRTYAEPQGWRKVGEFICSAPEVMGGVDLSEVKEQVRHKSQGKNQWQRVEVSQCFRGIR